MYAGRVSRHLPLADASVQVSRVAGRTLPHLACLGRRRGDERPGGLQVASTNASTRGVILIVDDDPVIRTLLRRYLPDWTVVEAPDGETGLAKAQETRPDLIIADWSMPRLTGPAMVKRLRADPSLSHLPVVMLTEHTDVEYRAESYQSGADHFLPKGCAPEELLAIIDRAVQRTRPLQFAAPLMQALHDLIDPHDGAEIGDAVRLLGDFQRRMLPAGEFRLGNLTVGASLVPSVIASGDFYDYVAWDDGRELGFVIGDVSGHGLAAAYFMVMVRTALRVLCRQHCRLNDAVTALNDILFTETPPGWFVTLFHGVANPRTSELRYVNAGHCPAVLCRPSPVGRGGGGEGRTGEGLLAPTGPALGLFGGHAYEERTVTLGEGDHLAVATDGVIDAVRTNNLDERYDWVRRLVSQNAARTPSQIAEALVRGAAADAVGDHRDDLAALVLHRTA
ncbi:MAG: fused response regulator/phosphatase [Armatimonadetes bacterium]|nr:fused response regulator/phosphatase [Armatimonadota bacterium]